MSLRSPHCTPIPSNSGEPVSIEFIESTGKRRITRRFTVPVAIIATVANLNQVVGPYGTADGAIWAGLSEEVSRPVDGTKVYPLAKLVEVSMLAAPARSPEQAGEDAAKRWVVCVYEETAYVLSDSTDYDAQGAITQRQRTVVLAVGEVLATVLPVPEGFTRVTLPEQISQGRRTWSVTDVRGDGTLSTGDSDDGDDVYRELTTAHPTEPAAPAIGTFASYRKVWSKGYWTLTLRRRLTNAEMGGARVPRRQTARDDGSIVEVASGTETAPTTSLTGDNVYLIESGTLYKAGGVIGYSRTWVKPPADWDYPENVEWVRPGLATITGMPDAVLTLYPPMQRVYPSTVSYTYGELVEAQAPWQAAEWAYLYSSVTDDAGNKRTERQALNGYVGAESWVLSSGSGSWNGLSVVSPSLAELVCATAARPSGITIIESHVRPYLFALDGTRIRERRSVIIDA